MFNEKFDRILWRINGVLFLLCIAAIALTAAFSIFSHLKNSNQDHVDLVVQSETSTTNYSLGYPHHLKGTDYHLIPLYAKGAQKTFLSSDSYLGGDVKNYIFFDAKNKKSDFMLDQSTESMELLTFIYDKPLEKDKQITTAIVFKTVDQKTPHLSSILLFDLKSQGFKVVLENLKSVSSVSQIDSKEILIAFVKSANLEIATYSLTEGEVKFKKEFKL
jgi:hypothetical protein